jgi:hypothetical protein
MDNVTTVAIMKQYENIKNLDVVVIIAAANCFLKRSSVMCIQKLANRAVKLVYFQQARVAVELAMKDNKQLMVSYTW